MAENLKVRHFRDGDAMPNIANGVEWSNLLTGGYCSYELDGNNIDLYGLLYNWFAVNDTRKFAPEGWHIPTDEEWKELEIFLGMNQSEADGTGSRGTDEGGKLKVIGTNFWIDLNTGATNESGFAAVLSGNIGSDGVFRGMEYTSWMWSETENFELHAWVRMLRNDKSDIWRYSSEKKTGLSVRCVKD